MATTDLLNPIFETVVVRLLPCHKVAEHTMHKPPFYLFCVLSAFKLRHCCCNINTPNTPAHTAKPKTLDMKKRISFKMGSL